jgi:hypothetical protein
LSVLFSAFLNKLHERMSTSLDTSIGRVRAEYIKRCFDHMEVFLSENNKSGIERCLFLINNLLDSSEKKGVGMCSQQGKKERLER